MALRPGLNKMFIWGGCNRLTTAFSWHGLVDLIMLRTLRLAVGIVHYAHYCHNSEHAHASHSIRGQQTLYHTGICIPTNRHPWGRLSVRLFPWSSLFSPTLTHRAGPAAYA